MKYTNRQYASALLASLEEKPEERKREMIKHFLKILARKRDFRRINMILKNIEKQHLKKIGLQKVHLESPFQISPELKREINKIIGPNILFSETINPKILAGVKFLIDDEVLIDASAKRQLDRLFLNV